MTLNDLSPRRRQVAEMIGRRMTCPAIAEALECSPRTIHAHVAWIAEQVKHDDDLDLPAMRRVRRWVLEQAA